MDHFETIGAVIIGVLVFISLWVVGTSGAQKENVKTKPVQPQKQKTEKQDKETTIADYERKIREEAINTAIEKEKDKPSGLADIVNNRKR